MQTATKERINMDEKEQIREGLKKQLEDNKLEMLKNMKDEALGLKQMEELAQITLMVTSFEFTQKIVEDPAFMKQIMDQIEADKK